MSQTNGADEDILGSTLRASVASGAVLPTRGWSSVVRVLIPREGLLPAAVRAVVSSVRLSPQTVRERDAVVVELIGFPAMTAIAAAMCPLVASGYAATNFRRVSWELVRMRLIAGAWKATHEVPLFLFPYGQFH